MISRSLVPAALARATPGVAFALLLLAPVCAHAQQAPPPIRPIGRILSAAPDTFGNIEAVRALTDGRVLVNDAGRRKLQLFDPTLSHSSVIIDTASTAARQYPTRTTALFHFYGDSSLFLDPIALAMIAIGPDGHLGRIIAQPPVPEVPGASMYLSLQVISHAQFDGLGNVVFQGQAPNPNSTQADSTAQPGALDSAPIYRVNLTTHRLDTIAKLATTRPRQINAPFDGRHMIRFSSAPLSVDDDWTLLPDGTVAIVRAAPYAIDWIAPDGSRTTSRKLAHTWEHLADSTKERIADSARASDSTSLERSLFQMDSMGRARGSSSIAGSGAGIAAGGGGGSMGGVAASSSSPVAAGDRSAGGSSGTTLTGAEADQVRAEAKAAVAAMSGQFATVADLPDYAPPIYGNSALVDADGNLWLRAHLLSPPPGGYVYDVVNRAGQVIDRVQIPGGSTLIGFGKGEAFLRSREGAGIHLVRVAIH